MPLLDFAPSKKHVEMLNASLNAIAQQQSITIDDIKITVTGRFISINTRHLAQVVSAKLLEGRAADVVVNF